MKILKISLLLILLVLPVAANTKNFAQYHFYHSKEDERLQRSDRTCLTRCRIGDAVFVYTRLSDKQENTQGDEKYLGKGIYLDCIVP